MDMAILIRIWKWYHEILGEWHTHPEVMTSPLQIDLHEWGMLSHHCHHLGGMPMIIVGIEEIWCGIAQKNVIAMMDKIK